MTADSGTPRTGDGTQAALATAPALASAPLVEVAGLRIEFPTDGGAVRAVDGLDFTLGAGGALGLVGESGSGKSATAYALLGLHRGTGARVSGTVRVDGTDVLAATDAELRRLRGGSAAMVFQDPLSALDPYYAIGDQIAEVYRVHHRVARSAARARAVEVLDRVGIADAARRSRSRPHEFSGGMRQRALIAMALACEPRLLIADEPTTALDVTVQAQILDLLHELRAETGMGLLLVTHDLGVVAGSVEEILVMRDGAAVERGTVGTVLAAPTAAYTRALLAAVPRLERPVAVGAGAKAHAAGTSESETGTAGAEPAGTAKEAAAEAEPAGTV
ncbi:MAG: ABC transporter ATP-binding protein, partial [Actinomycetia bacterium]|nr:ABC transporter ATP-binding protein [Actinomycetes bacterium]